MKKLEKILGAIIILSLAMKVTFIPGGAILNILSLAILSWIYYPLGFAFFNQIRLRHIFKKSSYQGISALRIIGAISIGMALSGICSGILFIIQHYAGGEKMLIAGLGYTGIILIIVLFKFFKRKDIFYKRILKRIAIIGGFGLLLLVFPDSILEYTRSIKSPFDFSTEVTCDCNGQDKDQIEQLIIEINKLLSSNKEYYKIEIDSSNLMKIICENWTYRFDPKEVKLYTYKVNRKGKYLLSFKSIQRKDVIELAFPEGKILVDHTTNVIDPVENGPIVVGKLCELHCLLVSK